jgi:hypothetical protein
MPSIDTSRVAASDLEVDSLGRLGSGRFFLDFAVTLTTGRNGRREVKRFDGRDRFIPSGDAPLASAQV